jgi:predicted ATP-dependent endonuclease of OLD family
MTKRLKNLRVERFRQLNEVSVDQLGDVNLIVGGNNCGKSTLLDAIRLYAAKASPQLVEDLLHEHGELAIPVRETVDEQNFDRLISNLFYKRKFPLNDKEPIYVGEQDKSNFVQLEHVLLREDYEEQDVEGEIRAVRRLKRISKGDFDMNKDAIEAIEISISDGKSLIGTNIRGTAIPLTDFLSGRRYGLRGRYEDSLSQIPLSYVPAKLGTYTDLADAWDEVVLTDGEQFALEALRLIEPDTIGLAFVQHIRSRTPRTSLGASRYKEERERSAVLKLKTLDLPVPLQSMGDGMTRVLQLILSACRAKNGFLLIDELENGIHHAVQVRIWRLIFDLAKKYSVQVFATTHSLDCVRTFSQIALQHELDGALLKMEKSCNETLVARVSEGELDSLMQATIEVR